MCSEGYCTWSARKLGSNLLCQGGGGGGGGEKGERRKGSKVKMRREKVGKLWMNKNYSFHHSLS